MHGECCVAVIEAGDEADRNAVLAHRVDEAPAEFAVLRPEPQRPAHRVDDAVEGLLDLPDLLDAELPLRRVLAGEVEVADRRAGQMPLRSLAQDGRAADQVRARLEVRQLLSVAATALVAGADAANEALLDEQLGRGGLGEDVDARLLGLLAEPAPELRDRRDVVAVVAERRRCRLQRDRAALGHEVDGVLRDRPVRRPVGLVDVGQQLAQRRRLHHRAGQEVRPRRLPLLDERDRDLPEALGECRLLLEQLRQPDRAGEPGRAAADDHHADLDPLVLGIGRRPDELLRRIDARGVVDRCDRHGTS